MLPGLAHSYMMTVLGEGGPYFLRDLIEVWVCLLQSSSRDAETHWVCVRSTAPSPSQGLAEDPPACGKGVFPAHPLPSAEETYRWLWDVPPVVQQRPATFESTDSKGQPICPATGVFDRAFLLMWQWTLAG